MGEKKTYGLAIATLITGILTVTGMVYTLLEPFFMLLTITFGIVSLIEIKKHPSLSGNGYVIAGFVVMTIFFFISSNILYKEKVCNQSFIEETSGSCDTACSIKCISKYFPDDKSELIYEKSNGEKTCQCTCLGCPTH